ncbi:hypothetical protein [uncultured Draconibacterium sp.]|uniref:hypothetical protein n=1 Tax=uncultured Draconibacterium sp. TaxID=1573823 RepID=UPI0029C6F505|nr:hypothetical protein [uncultured Draconibacterium sp.]
MKTIILTSILFMAVQFSTTIKAQSYMGGVDEFIEYNNINMANSRSDNSYADVEGTPFLYGDFVVGKVKLNNGKYYEGELRYDNYKRNLEFKDDKGDVYEVLTPEKINSVELGDVTLKYVLTDGEGQFFRQLVGGGYSLLAVDEAEYQDPKPARPYVEAKPARFVEKSATYFLHSDADGLVELKNKKSLAEVYPEKTKEINSFLKKEKTGFSSEEDLAKLVNYLNSL